MKETETKGGKGDRVGVNRPSFLSSDWQTVQSSFLGAKIIGMPVVS